MRIISGSKYNAHTDPIFKELNMLKISDLYNITLLKFYHKFKNHQLPYYFDNFLSISPEHSHQTRGRNDPRHSRTRTTHAMRSIRNSLPIFIKSVPNAIIDKVNTHSIHGFSLYCKKYYINQYNDSCNIENCYVCAS